MRECWAKNHDLREGKWHFLKTVNKYCISELRFGVESLKVPLAPNFSLISIQKQRNNDDFPLPKLSRHYDVILSN